MGKLAGENPKAVLFRSHLQVATKVGIAVVDGKSLSGAVVLGKETRRV